MTGTKGTRSCRKCKQHLPTELFDFHASGNGQRHERCRNCRTSFGQYGKGRPALPAPNPSGLCMCGCGQITKRARQTGFVNGDLQQVRGEHTCYITGHKSTDWVHSYVVDPDSGCWYPPAGNPRAREAHRRVYKRVKGPIPEGMDLDHECCHRRCINPDHLTPVTRQQNYDRDRARRHVAGCVALALQKSGHSETLRVGDVVLGELSIEGGLLVLRTTD
jgi:hypothetical protein